MQLAITIDEKFRKHLNEKWLHELIERCIALHEFDSEVELSLLITCDETVQYLNQRYRGVNNTTDVLSFALSEKDEIDFIMPPDGVFHLGEVIVSYTQAVRQAEAAAHVVEKEIALLVVHGVLHLLGYDHDEPESEKEMRNLEVEIMNSMTQ